MSLHEWFPEADKIKDSARQSKPLGKPKVLIGVVFLFFSLNLFCEKRVFVAWIIFLHFHV
ncbi:unnamed protein product, partial [Brassica rapa subsp. trilocularis]